MSPDPHHMGEPLDDSEFSLCHRLCLRTTASLRAVGLSGRTVNVHYADRALFLTGADGGSITIDIARAQRMRLGYMVGRHNRIYFSRIWLIGAHVGNCQFGNAYR